MTHTSRYWGKNGEKRNGDLFGRMPCAVMWFAIQPTIAKTIIILTIAAQDCKSESAQYWSESAYSLLLGALMSRVSSPRQSRHVQLFSDKSHPKYTSTAAGSNCSFPLARSSCHSTPQGRQGRIPRRPAVMLHRSASGAKCTLLPGYPSVCLYK